MSVFCRFCGAKIADGAKFCTKCGKEQVGAVAKAPAPQVKPVVPPVQKVGQPPTPAGAGSNMKLLAAGLIALIIAGGGYYLYTQKEQAQTAATEATQALDEAKKAKSTEQASTPAPPAEKDKCVAAQEILAKYGYDGGEVRATTYGADSSGFLALVASEATTYWVVDLANQRVARFMPQRSFLEMERGLSASVPPAMIVKFYVSNDAADKDVKAGAWQGSTHIIPIFGDYKVKQGQVIPGMLTTGVGESPRHLQTPLYEQKNVDMMNICMRQMMSLLNDARARNIHMI